eukprot:362262-Chlamydomonas_euryale.AAC.3
MAYLDGHVWVGCDGGQVCVISVATSKVVKTLKPHGETVDALAAVGNQMWSGSRDKVWRRCGPSLSCGRAPWGRHGRGTSRELCTCECSFNFLGIPLCERSHGMNTVCERALRDRSCHAAVSTSACECTDHLGQRLH